MPYTKTTWQDGDIITTEKLNKIENGIEQASSGGGRIIDLNEFEYSEEVDPNNIDITKCTYSGYEVGLSAEDFINSWIIVTANDDRRVLLPVNAVQEQYNHPETGGTRVAIENREVDASYYYNPETGEFFYYSEKEK